MGLVPFSQYGVVPFSLLAVLLAVSPSSLGLSLCNCTFNTFNTGSTSITLNTTLRVNQWSNSVVCGCLGVKGPLQVPPLGVDSLSERAVLHRCSSSGLKPVDPSNLTLQFLIDFVKALGDGILLLGKDELLLGQCFLVLEVLLEQIL